MRRVMKATTLATVGLAALAATAQAAPSITLSPVQACYTDEDSATLTGAGFTAGAGVNVTVDGLSGGSITADTAGGFAGAWNFGQMKGVKTHTITATDATNPALTASLSFVGTTHQVKASARGKPGKKSKLRGFGFIYGSKAYMHVRGHGIKSDTRIARPKAPCGTFVVKKAFVPSGAPVGKYRVQFDASKRFSKRTQHKLVYQLTVFRTFSSAATAGFALAG